MAVRIIIAEISAAIEGKNKIREDLTEAANKRDKESRRLGTELEKMNVLISDGKAEKDFHLARVKSEIISSEFNALKDYVDEEEKETEGALRARVESLKKEGERLNAEEADIRFRINEMTISPDSEKEEEEELNAQIAGMREMLEENSKELSRLREIDECRLADERIKEDTLHDLRLQKEQLSHFPEGCPRARKLRESIQWKKLELEQLTMERRNQRLATTQYSYQRNEPS